VTFETDEVEVRIAAALRLLTHGLMDGSTSTLVECAEQAVVLLGQAERFLEASP
jgi:hypothetical protein